MSLWISLLRVLILTLHNHIPEEETQILHTHTHLICHTLSCFAFQTDKHHKLHSPVQVVGKCRVLASARDEERAQILLQET